MAGENDIKIGKTIRAIREQKGMSQHELARRLGMTRTMLSDVEDGSYALRLSDVFYCADALGYDVHHLMRELGEAVHSE